MCTPTEERRTYWILEYQDGDNWKMMPDDLANDPAFTAFLSVSRDKGQVEDKLHYMRTNFKSTTFRMIGYSAVITSEVPPLENEIRRGVKEG